GSAGADRRPLPLRYRISPDDGVLARRISAGAAVARRPPGLHPRSPPVAAGHEDLVPATLRADGADIPPVQFRLSSISRPILARGTTPGRVIRSSSLVTVSRPGRHAWVLAPRVSHGGARSLLAR